jgi:hypothetical protein
MKITNEILQSLIDDSWPDYVTSGSPVSNRVYTRQICRELIDARARIAQLEAESEFRHQFILGLLDGLGIPEGMVII